MAKIKPKKSNSELKLFKNVFKKEFYVELLTEPRYLHVTCWFLLIFEVFLNVFIIQRVPYTEIDWVAYMQEVEGFLNGTLDYKDLRGDTGPLVYPAGFVYIYSFFYYITSYGKNIHLAQYLFLLIYIMQLMLSFRIYLKTEKVPPYALIISTLTSYRIHSIYVLRLFNDPIAILFFYVSLNLYISNKWFLGSLFYSLAVSIKMNILLYAPCLLLAFLTNLELPMVISQLFVCGLVQLILGIPFLYTNYYSYIRGSFDLGRIFEHKWTVNYRFLPIGLFESRWFHLALLMSHILLLLMFLKLFKRYLSNYAKLNYVFQQLRNQSKQKLNLNKTVQKNQRNERKEESLTKEQEKFLQMYENQLRGRNNKVSQKKVIRPNDEEKEKMEINFSKMCQLFVLPFFVTNLIGITCARSLHYQFYGWYFFSLLYLVHCTGYTRPTMFLLLAIIEYCWNVYPSTILSSSLLHFAHSVLLIGNYNYMSK